jgi:hypothetical protein
MDALSIASVCGVILATLAFLLANRWLPMQEQLFGLGRARVEILSFYALWLVASAHAVWRVVQDPRLGYLHAWREQCTAIALLAVLAVLANWLTTGDHLLATLRSGNGPVAGTDLCLLTAAALALLAAHKLRRRVPQEETLEVAHV